MSVEGVPVEAGGGGRASGTGVKGACETSDVGAGPNSGPSDEQRVL